MGEALDALTAEWGDNIQETVVLIYRFQPDQYFTQAQYDRMQTLLACRSGRRDEALTPKWTRPSRVLNVRRVQRNRERAVSYYC